MPATAVRGEDPGPCCHGYEHGWRSSVGTKAKAKKERRIAILGGGNLGQALARGWTAAGVVEPGDLQVVRRRPERLAELRDLGIRTGADNQAAAEDADLLVIAVQPQQIEALLSDIAGSLDPKRHTVISVVSGVSIAVWRTRMLRTWPKY